MNINFNMLTNSKILLLTIITVLLSYLIGSVNFAIILSKLFKKDDVRKHGSGNAGMTNMLRIYGKLPAALTAIGDFSKGIVSMALARLIFSLLGVNDFDPAPFCGFAALLGHIFPVYFGFKGGKGILTAFGIVLFFNPIVFTVLFLIYVPMAFITKIVSLASILGVMSYPIFTFIQNLITGNENYTQVIFGVLLAILPIYAHRANIKRLLNGTENKFGSKPKD